MNKIELDTRQQKALIDQLQFLFAKEFDETMSDFRAEQILDLLLKTIGPAIYNKAVQDVRAHLQSKLDDLDGEIYFDPD